MKPFLTHRLWLLISVLVFSCYSCTTEIQITPAHYKRAEALPASMPFIGWQESPSEMSWSRTPIVPVAIWTPGAGVRGHKKIHPLKIFHEQKPPFKGSQA